MKKVRYFLSLMLIALGSMFLFACGGNNVVDFDFSGVARAVELGKTLELDGFQAQVKYKDGTVVDVAYGDEGLEFVQPETDTVGEKDLIIKYNGYEHSVKISVYAPVSRTDKVVMLESEIVKNFDTNRLKMLNGDTAESKVYYVGDDNAFDLDMTARTTIPDMDGNGVPEVVDMPAFDAIFEVAEVVGGTATNLNETQIANYMTINTTDNTIDFKDSAIGHRFNITVKAENYLGSQPKFTLNNLEVIDAYNVYDSTGLSVLENTNATWNGWYSKKTPELRQASVDANGIVLHKNIYIVDTDLPEKYFYTEAEYATMNSAIKSAQNVNVVGSFKDKMRIDADNAPWSIAYERILTADDEGFTFCGNYNQIDYSGLSRVVIEAGPESATAKKVVSVPDTAHPEEGQPITTHATLFRIQSNIADLNKAGLEDAEVQALTQRVVDMNNISFVGNGKRSSNAYFSGGQLLAKFKGVSTDIERTKFLDVYTGYTFECQDHMTKWDNDKSLHNVKSTYGENCYTMNLFTWGSDVIVEDSKLLNAGGPAAMADYVVADDNSQEHIPHLDFINSTVESLVTGAEPWFGIYEGATQIFTAMLEANPLVYLNSQLPPTGRTMVTSKTINGQTQNNLFNLACIFKGNANGVTQGRIKGSVTVYENRTQYDSENPADKPYGLVAEESKTSAIYDGAPLTDRALTNNIVYFQSNLTGGYFNSGFGSANMDATFATDGRLHATPTPEGQDPKREFANCYIFNGMCLLFELFPTA